MLRSLNIYILLITSILIADEGSISGQVQDLSNPLYGANVFLVGTSMGATTDSSGKYLIDGIPVGKYILQQDIIFRSEGKFLIHNMKLNGENR